MNGSSAETGDTQLRIGTHPRPDPTTLAAIAAVHRFRSAHATVTVVLVTPTDTDRWRLAGRREAMAGRGVDRMDEGW